MNLRGMVQLLSPDLAPTAGYAYTLSIAAQARQRRLTTLEQLADYLETLLRTIIGPIDAPAASLAFHAARNGDIAALPAVGDALGDPNIPASLQIASLHMGATLWETSRHWEWTAPVHEQIDPLAPTGSLHHAIAFGALSAETTASPLRAIAACLLHSLRAMITTARRAIGLSESADHSTLQLLQPAITDLAHRYAAATTEDLTNLRLPPCEFQW
jgi:urease accessory protein UreF